MTANKTAMQNFIENAITANNESKDGYVTYEEVIAAAQDFLEEEKKQIIEAYHIPGSNIRTKEEGEKYYNQRYNINV
jgi:hypothetical protein